MHSEKEIEEFKKLLSDKHWRINSWKLYFIKDKYGRKIPFKPNKHQRYFADNRHTKNIILKARQLGFTTYIDIDKLDDFLFTSYSNYGIIAQDKDTAKEIFDDKVKFAFDNLPEWLREMFKLWTDKKGQLESETNSTKLYVSGSFRSGTLQGLHLSEFWKICAKYPEKAREIITGALNTLAPECRCDIESTAEGNAGYFFDMSMTALANDESWKELTNMDYKFFFFPWFEEELYTMPEEFPLTEETINYFITLQSDEYIRRKYPNLKLTDWQKRWYQKKKEEQKEDMVREFPSYPKEAFDLAIRGAYYEKELTLARTQKRIMKVNYDDKLPVYTHWDIWGAGWGDENAIWFYQIFWKEVRLLEYWQGSGMWLVEVLNLIVLTKPYKYEKHYFPHDIAVTELTTGVSRYERMCEVLWKSKVEIVPKLWISDGIGAVKDMFINCYFDESKCIIGLQMLSQYRKQWDKSNGMFLNEPIKKNQCKHGSDAFRYLWVTYRELTKDRTPIKQSPPTFHNKITGAFMNNWKPVNKSNRFWL